MFKFFPETYTEQHCLIVWLYRYCVLQMQKYLLFDCSVQVVFCSFVVPSSLFFLYQSCNHGVQN